MMLDSMALKPPTQLRFLGRLAAFAVVLAVASLSTHAQELEPRAYRTLPTGFNFAVLSYGFMTGNVVSDATSPVQDLDLDVNIATH